MPHIFNDEPKNFISSGNFTPGVSAQSNLTGFTHFDMKWMRVGNMVTVSGNANAQATSVGQCFVEIDLPFASDLTTSDDCTGSGYHNSSSPTAVFVSNNTATNKLQLIWNAGATTNSQLNYVAMYEIK
jgi:hypothetical protein